MAARSADPRIEVMYRNDCRAAYGILAVLWLVFGFVYAVTAGNSDSGVALALLIGGSLVLLFNTASILAMTSHYAGDKQQIYGLDLRYQDANKRRLA